MSPKVAAAMFAIILIVFFVGFFLGATGAALHYEQQLGNPSDPRSSAAQPTMVSRHRAHIEDHLRRCHSWQRLRRYL